MKVYDKVEKVEKDLDINALLDQIAHHDRQVNLVFHEKQKGFDGLIIWDEENWVSISSNKYLRSFFCDGVSTDDALTYVNSDIKGDFHPEEADEVILG